MSNTTEQQKRGGNAFDVALIDAKLKAFRKGMEDIFAQWNALEESWNKKPLDTKATIAVTDEYLDNLPWREGRFENNWFVQLSKTPEARVLLEAINASGGTLIRGNYDYNQGKTNPDFINRRLRRPSKPKEATPIAAKH